MHLLHPGVAFLPSAHVADDSVFNWIIQRNREGMENADSDIEDVKMSANQTETNSDDGSREYEEAFENVRICLAYEHEGPLQVHCMYCDDYKL